MQTDDYTIENYSHQTVEKMVKKILSTSFDEENKIVDLVRPRKKIYLLLSLLNDVIRIAKTNEGYLSISYILELNLLKLNTPVDENNSTVLHTFVNTCYSSNHIHDIENIFELLYDYGSDLFQTDNKGNYPIDILIFGIKNVDGSRTHRGIYNFILNEFFRRKTTQNSKHIINIMSKLSKEQTTQLFSILYTTTVVSIKNIMRQYRNIFFSKLATVKRNNNSVFHQQQLAPEVYKYISVV